MRLAVAQLRTTAGDLSDTVDRMVDAAKQAKEQGADLVVFPFAALTGAMATSTPSQEGFLLDIESALDDLASRAACACLVPISISMGESFFPEAVLISDGNLEAVVLEASLRRFAADVSNKGEQDEASFGGQAALPVFRFGGVSFGVAFDYDGIDEFAASQESVDVLLFISSMSFAMDDNLSVMGSSLGDGTFLDDAEDLGAWLVGVGSLGTYGCEVFAGSSFAVTPWGEIAAQAPSFEQAVMLCDIDPSFEGPLMAPISPEVADRMLVSWNALSFGLAGLAGELGTNQAAVLLDGTLSSCAVAALATDALGPTNVFGLVLTGLGDGRDMVSRTVAQNLRLTTRELPISALSPDAELARDLACAHLKSLARENDAIVLSSLDKTSLALGEGGAAGVVRGVMPFGDVYFSDIIELAHFRNTISPVIPQRAFALLEAPSVAGLEECGITAAERIKFLDYVLASYIEWELPLSEVVDKCGHEEVVSAIIAALGSTEPSRRGTGISLVASSKTLEELNQPLGFAWSDRFRPQEERMKSSEEDAAQDLRDFLEELGVSPDAAADQTNSSARQPDVDEVLGYLRDLSMTGGLMNDALEDGRGGSGRHDASDRHGPDDRPNNGSFWRTFSEN
jgi:NAD+ synthase (glutamine-hydrolysing)